MFPFFKKSENKERDEEYYNSLADSDFIVSGEEFDYNDDEPVSIYNGILYFNYN